MEGNGNGTDTRSTEDSDFCGRVEIKLTSWVLILSFFAAIAWLRIGIS